MGANKFVFNGETKFDLTEDSIIPAAVLAGYTFHGADGEEAVGTYEGGSSGNKVIRGIFNAGTSATYVDVTFDEPLENTPLLIFFWEATTTYASYARTKGGFGMTERIAHYGSGGATTYYQRRWYGSSSNSMSAGSNTYPITASNGTCIRSATKNGFRAYYYSSSYRLYGTYNYLAVCE